MIGATQLEHWDRCRRLWQFGTQYQANRVTPLGAVYQALHLVLHTTRDTYTGPEIAREWVMELAGKRGVQTDRQDPYDLMTHYAHMAECLARVLRQPNTDPLQIGLDRWGPHHTISFDEGPEWKIESYAIDGGMRLMRFVMVDHWDDDRQLAELHSWRTIGDVCVTGLPMTLRILVIGQSRNGKRYGHWTRAKQHPYNKSIRFKRKHSSEEFAGDWRVVWREDTQVTAQGWVEQMARDQVLRESAFDVWVKVPGKLQQGRVLDDIKRIADEMEAAEQMAGRFPMTRSACDDAIRGACRYQQVCYAPMEIEPEETGLFTRRDEHGK